MRNGTHLKLFIYGYMDICTDCGGRGHIGVGAFGLFLLSFPFVYSHTYPTRMPGLCLSYA